MDLPSLSTTADPGAEIRALLGNKRRRLLKVGANVALVSVMLLGPYLRGHVRTRSLVTRFAALSACMYGGVPRQEPGLGLPRASESYFAARVLGHDPRFPQRCIAAVDALVPEPAIFLFPSVKRTELDLAVVATLLKRELLGLSARAPSARIPLRPLRAMERLRGVLAEHTLASGMFSVPEADAVDFRHAHGLTVPTRVPVYAQFDARLTVFGSDSEFSTVAVDGRGLSYVNVGQGGLDQQRTPRPKLLEGFLRDGTDGVFVWAMSKSRCAERPTGCAGKTMGLGRSALPWLHMPDPRWVGAHPAGRIDRSVWVKGGDIQVLAARPDHTAALRSFAVDLSLSAAGSDMPPLEAERRSSVRVVGDAQLLEVAGTPWLLGVQAPPVVAAAAPVASDEPRQLVRALGVADDTPLVLAEVKGARGLPWVSSCVAGTDVRFVWGDDQQLQLGEIAQDGTVRMFQPVTLAADRPVDAVDAAFDGVRALCAEGARALVRDRNARLYALVADEGPSVQGQMPEAQTPEGQVRNGQTAQAPRPTMVTPRVETLATDVRSFSSTPTKLGLLVAFAGTGDGAQVRLLELDTRGHLRGNARAPAACFNPAGGLCGSPTLARVGSRLVLAAREGTDLLAIESADEGAHWAPLKGLGRTD